MQEISAASAPAKGIGARQPGRWWPWWRREEIGSIFSWFFGHAQHTLDLSYTLWILQ
jgi:hypothetical protein